MNYEGKSKRLRERLKLAMPVRVRCREAADFEWEEISRLIDVTPFGARFTLTHLTEPGRLLQLTIPMPRQLRCFDHAEPQYRVWAVVRNLRAHQAKVTRGAAQAPPPRFEIGVAFAGKHPPASFMRDPSTRYEIRSLTPGECAYAVIERAPPAPPSESGERAERKQDTRLSMPVDVSVEVFDEHGMVSDREQTVTENISRRGAAVFTTLSVERGRFVRLTSVAQNLSVIAAVRARRAGPDGIPRLHLEFIDREWPLEGVGEQ